MNISNSDIKAADHWFTFGDSGRGSFVTGLFKLASVADTNHLVKLHEAFPDFIGGWVARNVMGEDIMRHLDDEHEWVVTPGEISVGNWLVNRRLKIEQPVPCIKRTFFGGEELIGVLEFVHDVVQDEEIAYKKLVLMLDTNEAMPWNEDDSPNWYMEFEIVNRAEVIVQMNDISTEEPMVCGGTGQHDNQPIDDCDECNPKKYHGDDIDDFRGPDGVLGNDAPKD